MSEPIDIHFHFDADPDADTDELARLIQERVAALADVEEAHADSPGATRLTGAEVVAGIALTVTVLREGKNAAQAIKELVDAVTELVRSARGLKRAVVELGGTTVPVEQLDEEGRAALAEQE